VVIDETATLFADAPTLRALALVENGRPVGLLNRQTFVDRYARPFFRKLYGRRPSLLLANTTPLMLDKHTGLDALTAVLTSSDQRYLTEGFIVTEGGRYLGLGTGEQLVRVVTEVRIEAARHANPLTFLPGNIPISEHIACLLSSGIEADDRHGVRRFFPCTTLAIGAVTVRPGVFGRPEEVASAAATAKHEAKLSRIGLAIDVGSPAAKWHGLPPPRPAPMGWLRPAGPSLAQARTAGESFTAAKESR
jgi:hypothetical protein